MAPDSLTEAIDATVMRSQTRVGTTLRGKWRLDVLLGVGGMAAVYAATHRNGTRAAIKILHPELSTHAHVRSRFLREGRVANTVNHPGAVKVVDEDEDSSGAVFLVMELLDGESLEARAARLDGKLPVDEVLAAADQLLDVLIAAHDKGVIHRDLKPENVFLTRDGQIKVLDFGIARLRELSTASSATRAGSTMGSPQAMPPEQARGLWDEVDARSDLWAVGALMFALLAGRSVHEGRTTNEVLLSAMTKPAAPLASVVPTIHGAVARVVDRALAYERDGRWPDARAMQNAVRHAFHEIHKAPISTAPKLTVPPSVADRTLPSGDVVQLAPGRPSDITALPVSTGQTGVSIIRTVLDRPALAAAGGVVFCVLVVAVIVIGAVTLRSRAQVPATAGSGPVIETVAAAPSTPVAPVAAPAPSVDASAPVAPVVAVEDLPTAAPAGNKRPKAPLSVTPPPPPLASSSANWKDVRR